MMNTLEIITLIRPTKVVGMVNFSITDVVFDSRIASSSSLFVAIKGVHVDGHDFIYSLATNGVRLIVSEVFVEVPDKCCLLIVENSARALGVIAAAFYGNPSNKLKLIGITGTNGKTTSVTLLHALFLGLGYKVGLLSTVVNKIGLQEYPSTHTTPDPISLNKLLAEMVSQGCDYCFMEVSSHAVVQERIAGLCFQGGVFTNITHDHLDYHGTFKEYIFAKKRFFDQMEIGAFALTNVDDKNGQVMMQNTKALVYSYALKSPADFKVKIMENQFSGLVLNINNQEVWTKLIGSFNAYNLLVVYAVSILLEQDPIETLSVLSNLDSVVGRFQYVRSNTGIIAIVDYAHTPDALENVLHTIGSIRSRNETVFTVIGCGGDRDKTKRPKMASIACDLSDKVIITSDNPRSENPEDIIKDMMEGVSGLHFKKTLSISDREQAIKTACAMALPSDIILIAGKGHENYQEINGVKHHFDDMEIVKQLFIKLGI